MFNTLTTRILPTQVIAGGHAAVEKGKTRSIQQLETDQILRNMGDIPYYFYKELSVEDICILQSETG